MDVVRDARDASKQVDGALERAKEDSGASQEEIACAGALEVEDGGGALAFDELHVKVVEEGTEQLALLG